jgi:hypothetical protein
MPRNKASHHRGPLALGLLLGALSPIVGEAKDGRDDDTSSHGVTVAAAAWTELPALVGVASARSGGAFTVHDGANAALLCPLPADRLASSSGSGDGKAVPIQVAYLDSDGPGMAGVRAQVIRTALATARPGFQENTVCEWSSNGGAVVGTTATFSWPAGIADGAFYHLRVELGSVPGSAGSFLGVVVQD